MSVPGLVELHAAALRHVCGVAPCPCSHEACPRRLLARAVQDAYYETKPRSFWYGAGAERRWVEDQPMRGGLQADGSWVAGNSGDFPGDNARAWLHSPGRRGPLAKVVWREDGGPRLIQLRTREEAAEIAERWRVDGRRYQEDYRRRLELAERLVAAGVPLPYTAGPCGGYLMLPTGKAVSLPGVLRRLGVEARGVVGSHFRLPPAAVVELGGLYLDAVDGVEP